MKISLATSYLNDDIIIEFKLRPIKYIIGINTNINIFDAFFSILDKAIINQIIIEKAGSKNKDNSYKIKDDDSSNNTSFKVLFSK